MIRIYGKQNGINFQRVLSYHKCTDEEYEEFQPIKQTAAGLLKEIRENPERGMYCIEWNDDDPIKLYGTGHEDDFARIDVIFVPCNYLHTMLDYKGDTIHPECVGDKQK